MTTYIYRCKGSADDGWNEGREVEAETKAEAQKWLDSEYGVQRDDQGKQTNSKMIKVEITGEK